MRIERPVAGHDASDVGVRAFDPRHSQSRSGELAEQRARTSRSPSAGDDDAAGGRSGSRSAHAGPFRVLRTRERIA